MKTWCLGTLVPRLGEPTCVNPIGEHCKVNHDVILLRRPKGACKGGECICNSRVQLLNLVLLPSLVLLLLSCDSGLTLWPNGVNWCWCLRACASIAAAVSLGGVCIRLGLIDYGTASRLRGEGPTHPSGDGRNPAPHGHPDRIQNLARPRAQSFMDETQLQVLSAIGTLCLFRSSSRLCCLGDYGPGI